jgi:hypothetical protein
LHRVAAEALIAGQCNRNTLESRALVSVELLEFAK